MPDIGKSQIMCDRKSHSTKFICFILHSTNFIWLDQRCLNTLNQEIIFNAFIWSHIHKSVDFYQLLFMVGIKLLVRNDNVCFAIRSESKRSWSKADLFPLAIKAAGCFQCLWIHKTTVIAGPFVKLHIHWDILTCSNELLGCTWTVCIS